MQWGSLTLGAVRLDAPSLSPTAGGTGVLHPVELGRAAAMPEGPERDRFLAGRTAIRRFAADLLGAEPAALGLDYACANCGRCGPIDHGRPGYRSPAGGTTARLSLSRSGPWCVVVGTTDPAIRAVGVDLEDVGGVGFAGFDDVALTPAERSSLRRIGEPEAQRMRARLWARKEAFLKVTGAGLFREPSDVDASGGSLEGIEWVDDDPAPLTLPPELVLAVAVARVR